MLLVLVLSGKPFKNNRRMENSKMNFKESYPLVWYFYFLCITLGYNSSKFKTKKMGRFLVGVFATSNPSASNLIMVTTPFLKFCLIMIKGLVPTFVHNKENLIATTHFRIKVFSYTNKYTRSDRIPCYCFYLLIEVKPARHILRIVKSNNLVVFAKTRTSHCVFLKTWRDYVSAIPQCLHLRDFCTHLGSAW